MIRPRFCPSFASSSVGLTFIRCFYESHQTPQLLYWTSERLPSSRNLGRLPHCNVLPDILRTSVSRDLGPGNSQISPPAFSFFPPGNVIECPQGSARRALLFFSFSTHFLSAPTWSQLAPILRWAPDPCLQPWPFTLSSVTYFSMSTKYGDWIFHCHLKQTC